MFELKLPTNIDNFKERIESSPLEWKYFADYGRVAEEKLTFKSELANSVSKNLTSATSSQTRISWQTSDYTWQTLCTYTTMAMYFDAFGRRVDPALMGTKRPHSINLNKTLHDKYGCKPSFSAIATNSLSWANSKKLSSSLSFTKYYAHSSNSVCWNRHKTQIDKGLPTMVGYAYEQKGNPKAHITMGIGYTSDNYYIIRDTWTNDNKPLNTTFYYNKNGYDFRVLGLNYENSNTNTAWGKVVLKKGDSNINVRRLKIMLRLLYYTPDDVTTNTFGTATENAVKAFQSDYGLTVDGIVGTKTYKKLKTAHIMKYDSHISNWRVLSVGKKGDDVAQLQIRLYRMGYLTGTVDGEFGINTKNALMQYQSAKGLTADGIAGANTFAKLYASADTYLNNCYYLTCTTCYNPSNN